MAALLAVIGFCSGAMVLAAAETQEVRPLLFGATVDREMSGGDTHRYWAAFTLQGDWN